MGLRRRRTAGLFRKKAGAIWHIDKIIEGQRVCQSTGTTDLAEAERFLARRMELGRQSRVYGVRKPITFDQAAAKFVMTQKKRSLSDDISRIKNLLPWIGALPLHHINMGSLEPWLEHRLTVDKVKTATINHGLKVVRRILNLAASQWYDGDLTWLDRPPKIVLLKVDDDRKPNPLSWQQQDRFFSYLPAHLRQMALFAVNTGCRDQEICQLRWEWEAYMDSLQASFFVIPGAMVKNSQDRLVVLNREATKVVDAQRGKHPTHVFCYQGKPVTRMTNSGWYNAQDNAGMPDIRPHDMKHTFGARLRACGVNFEDRQDLLGHKSTRITTHYCAAELSNLVKAANRVCDADARHQSEFLVVGKRPVG